MASPAQTSLTPAELVAARPDIAAMRADLPKPGPSSVTMQAAAHAGLEDTRAYMTYAGQKFYLKHDPDAFDLADLAEYMENAQQAPVLALGGINRLLRSWLADYEGLRAAFRTELAGKDLDAQMTAYGELAGQLFETTTARPTAAPAGSSDGRTPTSTSSKDASPSPEPSPSTGPSGSERSTPG